MMTIKHYLHSDKHDNFAFAIWTDVLLSSLSFWDDPTHQRQLDCIYSGLVESLHVSVGTLIKMTRDRSRLITGWNWYCNDLHVKSRILFLNWCRSSRLRNKELFETMKTSHEDFN